MQDNPLLCIICGYERSGTTLVSELVRQHPGVDGRFECGFLLAENIADFINMEPYASNLKRDWGLTQESLEYICQAPTWLDAYRRLRERAVIHSRDVVLYDKTPSYLGALQAVMDKVNVPCICVVRDPRALYWSHQKYAQTNMRDFCRYYARWGRAYREANEAYPGRVLLVRLEELCTDARNQARRIYDFLGLEFQERYLSLSETINPYVARGGITDAVVTEYKPHLALHKQAFMILCTREFSGWHWAARDNSDLLGRTWRAILSIRGNNEI